MKSSKFEIRKILFSVCVLFTVSAYAQLDNSFISDRITLNEADSNRWGFTLNNFNYMRNTEYFNDIEVGRTLFGYQLNPSLFIQPNHRVKLQAGIFVRSDFGGNTDYTQTLPTFSVKINSLDGKESFIFGTLEGALAHRMIEPLFDINSAIDRRIENGAQYKRETKHVFLDFWINWEQFIQRGSPYKEVFTSGISSATKIINASNGFYLSVPWQFIAHHHGGQIDTDTANITMQFNTALGLQVGQVKSGWIDEWRIDGYLTKYKENTSSGYFPYPSGTGFYSNIFVRKGGLGLMASYWQGNQWIAPRGSTIYSSVSLDKPGVVQPDRQLIFVRLLYNKPLSDGLTLSARLEPFYDLKSSILDYSYSLYISYKLDRTFGKLKPNK